MPPITGPGGSGNSDLFTGGGPRPSVLTVYAARRKRMCDRCGPRLASDRL